MLENFASWVNARCETIFEKLSFKNSIVNQRCIIPATGFFEWQSINKKKYPYYIFLEDVFSVAGIWSEWINELSGELVKSFSIITTPANNIMKEIHNTKKRMPLILHKKNEKEWLNNNLSKEEIKTLMKPFSGNLTAHTISPLITKIGTNSNVPEIQKPFQYDILPGF